MESNRCYPCTKDEHCGTDNDCNQQCIDNHCLSADSLPVTKLDCGTEDKYCLANDCVGCIENEHCPRSGDEETKTVCISGKCEECGADVDCRSDDDCDGWCDSENRCVSGGLRCNGSGRCLLSSGFCLVDPIRLQ